MAEDYKDGELHEMYFPTNRPEMVEKEDILGTTTSDFEYDAYSCSFERKLQGGVLVLAKWVDSDYSEFVPGKCSNGGCYGFDFYEVVKVISRDDYDVYVPDNTGYEDNPVEITGEVLEEIGEEF